MTHKVIVITGATEGIGRAAAAALWTATEQIAAGRFFAGA
jgi:NAD(P)-dependent dehydrogenase (short-subunit alcohol dehydrogenase family)